MLLNLRGVCLAAVIVFVAVCFWVPFKYRLMSGARFFTRGDAG